MNRIALTLWGISALAIGGMNIVLAQDFPKTQPKLLTIWREEVKVGRNADHAKNEAGWPAAFEKARFPDSSLALTSLTGPNEAWYLGPSDSYAAIAASMKREENDPVLAAELARLGLADAEFVSSSRVIQAQARADLTVGTFPDLAKTRFFAITVYRLRPGFEAQFEEAAKAYSAARMRVAPKHGFRIYQVIAGMPAPTFLVFASVQDYAEFDDVTAAHQASLKALSAEEQAARQKFQREGVISVEMNRFKLDPAQSYVSKEVRAQDPAFWSPK